VNRDDERLYRCAECLDVGYPQPRQARIPRRFGEGFISGPAVWFCDCHLGRLLEAGFWLSQVFPWHPPTYAKRGKSDSGEARFREYLLANPHHRGWLPERVEELRQRDNRKAQSEPVAV
jgi:hypothetical protein